jgi:putative peptidoglycan lipid II flippase
MKLIRSIVSVGIYTIFSRVTGFARDILMASLIGAGATMDALVIAIKIPSFLRRIFAEGAFNASFVPIFNDLLHRQSQAEAIKFARTVLSFITLSLLGIILVFEIWMPWLLPLLVPGFKNETLALAIDLSRITFPFALLISLVALFSGILNSLERFDAAASSPIAGNIFLVGILLMADPHTVVSGKPVAVAILGSGVAQMIWVLIPCFFGGIPLKFEIPRLTPPMRQFMKRFVPGALGSGVFQVQLFVGMSIGSLLPAGTMSYLHYADRLHQLPISVIGGAISTALLPALSRQSREGNHQEALFSQNRAIEFSLLISLPAMIALTFLSYPLISVIFYRGAFSLSAVQETAYTLTALSMGLPAYILIKIFNTSFFSRQDTATPLQVAGISILMDLGLNLLLMSPLKHVGIALSTAISAWISASILLFLLKRRGLFKMDERLKRFLVKIISISLFTWGGIFLLSSFLTGSLPLKGSLGKEISHLLILLGGGGGLFYTLARSLGCTHFSKHT